MSTTVPTSLNGRMKKTLAFQLDRLDTILDGLADALNGAVADAVKTTVGEAAREAVKVALDEALAQVAAEKPKASKNPISRCWNWFKAMVSAVVSKVKSVATAGYQKVKQFGTRYTSATVLAVQAGVSTLKSRSLRIGMMLGAIGSCVVSLFRRDAKLIWWGAGIIVCTMLLERYLGTLVTLVLGSSFFFLTAQPRVQHSFDPVIVQQAA